MEMAPRGEMGAHPIIHPLVVSTEQDEVILGGQLPGERLAERLALRRQQDDLLVAGSAVPAPYRVDRGEERIGLHHHPRAAAIGAVVGGSMAVSGEVAQIVHRESRRCPLPGRA